MPHPSGPNSYPSAPGNYPSAPDAALGAATGTVIASGSAHGLVIAGAVVAANVAVASIADPTLTAHASATGVATSSAAESVATQFAAIGVVTSGGTADAGGTSAYGSVRSTGTATANARFAAAAAATVHAAGAADGVRVRPAAASGTVHSDGAAAGVRVRPASATGTATSVGFAGELFHVITTADGFVASSAVAQATQSHPAFARPIGPLRPQVAHPRKRLLVVDTMTGRRVAELPFTALSWNSPLNDVGKCTATLLLEASLDAIRAQGVPDPRAMLRGILTGPYRFSLVACYGSSALMGGPLQPSTDIAGDRVNVAANGMEKMLDKRILNRPTGTGTWADPSRDVAFLGTNVRYAMLSVVQEAITDYHGEASQRRLPITCNHPPPPLGLETFTWNAYDLVRASKALDELAARYDGPDWRLEPYLVEEVDGEYVYWDLQIGDPYLPASGNIGPTGPLPWTFSSATSTITHTIDVSGMASAYFATGQGQDREKIISRSDIGKLRALGFPAMEEIDSATSTNANTGDQYATQNRADALVAAHYSPTDTWSIEIPVDGSPNVGLVRRGDVARIEVWDKLYAEPGYHLRRITDITDGGGRTASLSCDLDDDLVEV